MVGVRRSKYRQPLTPKGIEKIEKGRMEWLEPDMFANFNTGALEQYLDEKNRRDAFRPGVWSWKKVIIAILIGALFAMVNQYVGLKVGMVIAGSWYIVYLIGMVLRWSPPSLNIAATASNGAAMICTGFVFSFPAIYILALDPAEMVNGEFLIDHSALSALLPIAISASMISGVLGVMYFIIFRRIWLVEDPLPTPGFEALVKLMDLSRAVSPESSAQAKSSALQALKWISISGFLTFLRDFPLFSPELKFKPLGGSVSILDRVSEVLGASNFYSGGDFIFTKPPARLLDFRVNIIPIQFGVGWFMKFQTALVIFLGTFFTVFVIVPAAILLKAPYFWPNSGEYFDVSQMHLFFGVDLASSLYNGIPNSPVRAAYSMAQVIAIGCILGGGLIALVKMLPVFKTVIGDVIVSVGKGDSSPHKAVYIPSKGWYEWPAQHILIVMAVTTVLTCIIFIFGGFNPVASVFFSVLLVLLTFILGAIAVKVMGETGTEPVSATSFLVLLALMFTFNVLLPVFGVKMSQSEIIVMSIIGTTVFGGAISMSGDVVMNFKVGLYTGNRPHDLVKATTLGLIPGAIISGIFAVIFSEGLGSGQLSDLAAPQAHAFSVFVKGLVANAIQWRLFIFGLGLGVFLELLVGIGTAFGLGMYLPLNIQIPMLMGGAARDLWEKFYLDPRVKRYNWGEETRTMKLMGTYMMATGLMVGEAVIGTIVALVIVVPSLGKFLG